MEPGGVDAKRPERGRRDGTKSGRRFGGSHHRRERACLQRHMPSGVGAGRSLHRRALFRIVSEPASPSPFRNGRGSCAKLDGGNVGERAQRTVGDCRSGDDIIVEFVVVGRRKGAVGGSAADVAAPASLCRRRRCSSLALPPTSLLQPHFAADVAAPAALAAADVAAPASLPTSLLRPRLPPPTSLLQPRSAADVAVPASRCR